MYKYSQIVDDDVKEIISRVGEKTLKDKFTNKSILITGASGMIGSYITYTLIKTNELLNTNIKVYALVRNEKKIDDYIKNNKNVSTIIQDVTQEIKIEGDVDYIIHAASPASPKIMKDYPVETNLANTLGAINTLKLAMDKKSSGYLFVSSREIYGEPNNDQELFTEDGPLGIVDPLVPRNGYAEGKKAAENLCSSYKVEYNLNTKIVRLAHTYGPGMSIDDGRVQADFLKNIINNEDIILKSDGSCKRTYTYIADAVYGLLLVLLKGKDLVYNISSENCTTTIKDLANTIISIKPEKNLKIIFDIEKENKGTASFKKGIISSQKIRKDLGWEPKYSLKEGFDRTIMHIESN